MELVDKSLQEFTLNEETTIIRVVEIGLLCLHHVPARRPTMSDIVAMLIGNKEIDHEVLQEYHQNYIEEEEDASTSSTSFSISKSFTLSHE